MVIAVYGLGCGVGVGFGAFGGFWPTAVEPVSANASMAMATISRRCMGVAASSEGAGCTPCALQHTALPEVGVQPPHRHRRDRRCLELQALPGTARPGLTA